MISVYIVSDSAGDTGETVVNAAIAQFHEAEFRVTRMPYVLNEQALKRIMERARQEEAIVLYTLVMPALRSACAELAEAYEVVTIDLMGSLVNALEKASGKPAAGVSGLNRQLNAHYFRKVEAVEFAVKYDDMRDKGGIKKADIVLVGVSRTSKTPLSMYLAHKAYKVANVPLVPELPPPHELYTLPEERIFGLTIGVPYLNVIRKERLKALGLPDSSSYATMARIEQELSYAEDIMRRLGCVVIDVSHRAIEETAGIIIEQYERSRV
jgi:regulator of PEP synthase PpsR (kinase-PPPase family)